MHNGPFCRRVLSATAAGLLILSSQLRSQEEIFPLRPNSSFRYAYYSSHWGGNVLDGFTTVSDSGVAEYTVRDSAVLNDTTVMWNVTQRYAILHSYHHSWGVDSLYWTNDSSLVSLLESTTGQHALTITSRVWAFPLEHASNPSQPIFRFGDSVRVLLVVPFQVWGYPAGRDSLWFSHYSGLYRRKESAHVRLGNTSYSDTLSMELLSDPILSISFSPIRSTATGLLQNYPNPFNPTTTIEYYIPNQMFVSLGIFDILGRKVISLIDAPQTMGTHHVLFNGAQLPTGIYFCRLHAGGITYTRKMVVQK